MTRETRFKKAIALIHEADNKHHEALHMLAGNALVAADHIVNAQSHNLDAITYLEISKAMVFNTCQCCGAKNGRAGLLINGECFNCRESSPDAIVVHTDFPRTPREVQKMISKKCPKRT